MSLTADANASLNELHNTIRAMQLLLTIGKNCGDDSQQHQGPGSAQCSWPDLVHQCHSPTKNSHQCVQTDSTMPDCWSLQNIVKTVEIIIRVSLPAIANVFQIQINVLTCQIVYKSRDFSLILYFSDTFFFSDECCCSRKQYFAHMNAKYVLRRWQINNSIKYFPFGHLWSSLYQYWPS